GHQAVRGQSCMQRAFGNSVTIRNVPFHDRAQPIDVEVRIFQLQRVKRPRHQVNPPRQRIAPLRKFQHSTNAAVAKFRKHRRHVRMDYRLAVMKSSQSQREPNHFFSGERAQRLPARFPRHDEQPRRRGEILTPSDELQPHALFIFRERRHVPHGNRSFRYPLAFAWSHSFSISSRGTSANRLPRCRALSSIHLNRVVNFVFACFSASSGSVPANRATFTTANSKSPNSSSTFA